MTGSIGGNAMYRPSNTADPVGQRRRRDPGRHLGRARRPARGDLPPGTPAGRADGAPGRHLRAALVGRRRDVRRRRGDGRRQGAGRGRHRPSQVGPAGQHLGQPAPPRAVDGGLRPPHDGPAHALPQLRRLQRLPGVRQRHAARVGDDRRRARSRTPSSWPARTPRRSRRTPSPGCRARGDRSRRDGRVRHPDPRLRCRGHGARPGRPAPRGPPHHRRGQPCGHRAQPALRRRRRDDAHRLQRPARRRARPRRRACGPRRRRRFDWADLDRYVMHQVSEIHTQALCHRVGIDSERVPRTFPTRGNIGPAVHPVHPRHPCRRARAWSPHPADGHRFGPQHLLHRVCAGDTSPLDGLSRVSTRDGPAGSPSPTATGSNAPGTCSTTGSPTPSAPCCASTATRPGPTSGGG